MPESLLIFSWKKIEICLVYLALLWKSYRIYRSLEASILTTHQRHKNIFNISFSIVVDKISYNLAQKWQLLILCSQNVAYWMESFILHAITPYSCQENEIKRVHFLNHLYRNIMDNGNKYLKNWLHQSESILGRLNPDWPCKSRAVDGARVGMASTWEGDCGEEDSSIDHRNVLILHFSSSFHHLYCSYRNYDNNLNYSLYPWFISCTNVTNLWI